MKVLAMAALVGLSLGSSKVLAQEPAGGNDDAEMKALMSQLEALKASYAQEVRRLRELDMQVQAMQARISGRTAGAPPAPPAAAAPAPAEGYASTAAEAEEAREAARRSVDDVKQQQSALFNRRLTLENSLSYARYDRKQLTLNGFLALDAIFLGNIAIENVESDSLTYNFAARWGVNPKLTLNLDVPYVARKTIYQKGGAGGSAAAIAQEETRGDGIGDVTVSANYKLFAEGRRRPETVMTVGVTAPTGREPYGLDWKVIERDDDDFIRFAVPAQQPTGNGVWQANLGLSAVKTADPAILFGNIGYIHSFKRSFDDIDSNPDTVNPGDVKLGGSYYFGAGVAFAFNERTSLSISFSDKLSARASTRYKNGQWVKVIGSDANAGTLNLGVTYALTPHATFVSMLGIGLTPDAPDFTLAFKVPYML
ncbi:transporter [Flavobacterium sp. MXW15]|uniref:Transporter n=2 Tax=Xanthomonas chitinilytica TaxID=2989819 RepID=A0ABT3JRR4_9XANT|nr:transporter [Xanthomonas sp. H13-6]MCW4453764.1 transporter [Flavobacterium sp. MXW15]MCW4471188.1 transporter [Xanthomonas sp. H13-6]